MIKVCAVTPLKLQNDSRTFKEANSVYNFGYYSIVIEYYHKVLF